MGTFLDVRYRGPAVLLSALLIIPASIEFLDRAVSTWSFSVLHRPDVAVHLTHIVDPIPPIAGTVLALAGLAALAGWRPGRWARMTIAASAAALVAIVLKDELKYAFGRTWPETFVANNPSWIGNGTFGFEPFHGGPGWASFPSGHTTVVTAPAAALWKALPRLWPLWIILPVLVGAGLLGADYHFLGDVIAGAYLGTGCGVGMNALIKAGRPA